MGKSVSQEDYNLGWTDAMKAARTLPEDQGQYAPFRSANGVLGAGPDSVIVDGDWLMLRLSELSEFTGEEYV